MLNKKLFVNVVLVIISNIVISFSFNIKTSFFQVSVCNLLLICVEILGLILFIKINKKEKDIEDFNENYLSYLKFFPFYFILLILLFSMSYVSSLSTNKSYNIIDDNKVIVYTTTDYYVVLDANIKNDKLIIYKGYQTKINNENVNSKLVKFKDVKIIE